MLTPAFFFTSGLGLGVWLMMSDEGASLDAGDPARPSQRLASGSERLLQSVAARTAACVVVLLLL